MLFTLYFIIYIWDVANDGGRNGSSSRSGPGSSVPLIIRKKKTKVIRLKV